MRPTRSRPPSPRPSDYDRVVAICRSGTTTEVAGLDGMPGTVRTWPSAASPTRRSPGRAGHRDAGLRRRALGGPDRFATSALVLLRACLGDDPVSTAPTPSERWTPSCRSTPVRSITSCSWVAAGPGLANEAALKLREAAGSDRVVPRDGVSPRPDQRCGIPVRRSGPSATWFRACSTTSRQPAPPSWTPARHARSDGRAHRFQRTAVVLAELRGLDPIGHDT